MISIKERTDAFSMELPRLVRGKVLFHVPMRLHNTFGVGGPADAWVEPSDEQDLALLLAYCRQRGVPWYVIGRGSNLLVRDGGIRGVIIKLASSAFKQILIEGNGVVAGGGVSNARLVEHLKEAQLSGMEFICGIPGGVGGGVAMNAGAHGSSYGDWVDGIRVMDRGGQIQSIPRAQLQFEYRNLKSPVQSIILSATMTLRPDQRERIQSRVGEFLHHRNATQPKGSSAGCVFRNPADQSAGRLVDQAGLKGLRVGGAWVSTLHGNFILNDRTTSSKEILELIEKVRLCVYQRTGIQLETEVKIIGEEG